MRPVELLVVTAIVLSLALLIVVASEYVLPGLHVRRVAEFYLYSAYNPFKLPKYTVMSPEVVTAIVWDYRGLDTLFETAVFYLALIGGLALSRGTFSESTSSKGSGLSVIVRSVTKITAPMIIAVGASIALHGHLTPGGGFQGGSVIAVVPMLAIVVFSVFFLVEKGVTVSKMVITRSIGLLGIGLTSIALFLVAVAQGGFAYVFQNCAKPGVELSAPIHVGGTLISGTLWFFNVFEMIAVATGFSAVFIVMILSRLGKHRGDQSGDAH